jgi:hypothetical protein
MSSGYPVKGGNASKSSSVRDWTWVLGVDWRNWTTGNSFDDEDSPLKAPPQNMRTLTRITISGFGTFSPPTKTAGRALVTLGRQFTLVTPGQSRQWTVGV